MNRITEVLVQIQDILNKLDAAYSTKVESLNSTGNTAVQAILSNLDNYITAKESQGAIISAFGTDTSFNVREAYLYLPYGVIAVLNTWPTYMKRDCVAGINQLYTAIRKAINEPGTINALEISKDFYTQTTPVVLRQVLANTSKLDEFTKLFERANDQAAVNIQNTSRKEFINQLGLLTSDSLALQDAMQDILLDEDDKLAIIRQLITDLLAKPELIEKQQLLTDLKKALDEAIKLDSQLFEVCAKLICPSILALDIVLPEVKSDTKFYQALVDYIDTQITEDETGILAMIEPDQAFVGPMMDKFGSIYDYCFYAHQVISDLSAALTNKNFSSFNYWDALEVTGEFDDNTEPKILLTQECIDQFLEIRAILDRQTQIADIKTCKLFDILQNNKLIIAWQDDEENWRSTSGAYYQRYSGNTWIVSPDWIIQNGGESVWTNPQGEWRNAEGKLVKVDLRREYNKETATGVWKDATGAEVIVNEGNDWLPTEDRANITLEDSELIKILNTLKENVQQLGELNAISKEDKASLKVWLLEEQLLNEIRALDRDREFYYNVPIEAHMAINFNENDAKLNTLLNPAVNYDINNINNNFVISKLDINYITSGLQLARSSQVR
jgi:hypothetical protein